MRNTTNIQHLNGLNVMNINNINIETNSITAINLNNTPNDCQPIGLPVLATKSQPKPKTKCHESSSRQTKRPPSERRFKCDQCERMFFTRKDVKRHLVVHTGIRNFACPYCTQRFGRKDHLVRHAKKSHNRDTRSSTALKTNSTHTSNKGSNAMPTLIQLKNGTNSTVPVLGQQMSQKQTFNYPNDQNGDHSALVLLTNSNNSHNIHNNNNNNDNQCSGYGSHSNPNSGIVGMHSNDSLCQYMSGVHSFEEMIASNAIKSETPPPLATAHHYFAFPVPPTPLPYPLPNSSFLPNCFVTNSNPNLSSCGSTATVAAFGIPVSNASNPIHTTFSVDVNPSLPHFSQAFQ